MWFQKKVFRGDIISTKLYQIVPSSTKLMWYCTHSEFSAFYVRPSCRAEGGGGWGGGGGVEGGGVGWWWVTQERHIDPSKQASQGGFNACVICSLARVGLGKGWFGTGLREGRSEKNLPNLRHIDPSKQASTTCKQLHLSIGQGRLSQGVIWNLMEG